MKKKTSSNIIWITFNTTPWVFLGEGESSWEQSHGPGQRRLGLSWFSSKSGDREGDVGCAWELSRNRTDGGWGGVRVQGGDGLSNARHSQMIGGRDWVVRLPWRGEDGLRGPWGGGRGGSHEFSSGSAEMKMSIGNLRGGDEYTVRHEAAISWTPWAGMLLWNSLS